MTETLKTMPYAQATVCRNDNGKIALVSYTTTVVLIDTRTGWVICFGTYSQTTRKHISAFCKEMHLGFDYQLMKRIFANGEKYNYYTGEIAKL